MHDTIVLSRYLLVHPDGNEMAVIDDSKIAGFTERHRLVLSGDYGPAPDDYIREVETRSAKGVIFQLERGWPSWPTVKLMLKLRGRTNLYFYWPKEKAIEVLDRHRFWFYLQLFVVTNAWRRLRSEIRAPIPVDEAAAAPAATDQSLSNQAFCQAMEREVSDAAKNCRVIPLRGVAPVGTLPRIDGTGVYMRTDYWNTLTAGGSYGHTCYVAKALAWRSRDFVALMASRFALLDKFGLRQVVVPYTDVCNERDQFSATSFYRSQLRLAIEALAPRYIYERLVPGNFAAAALSAELGVPYIVEYNGSEISMRRSNGEAPSEYERAFLAAEKFAFDQSTVISVVSNEVKKQVAGRGVDPDKILVNPNGADLDDYRPATPSEKSEIRAGFGFRADQTVIGFIGTFGFWHGVEVLAEALPRICAEIPEARFLLIGAGNYHHLVTQAVAAHGLQDRVQITGLLPQQTAQRALRACDIYVSPHHRHMIDSKFFGSPTKLFEYMALGGAIVASDLEQIGEVLRPFLAPRDLAQAQAIAGERAVLCTPGDVDEFVAACVGLCRRPDLRAALGANARAAAAKEFSWDTHVDKLLDFVAAGADVRSSSPRTFADPAGSSRRVLAQPALVLDDDYKMQAQQQWDNDACGSQYVKQSTDRLDFFMQAEVYRYGVYAPWMRRDMEFSRHRGKRVLEIGGGMGTDLAQFALAAAEVTDFDLSRGHLEHAKENFGLRGLTGTFQHGDAEDMPFEDNSFDIVYSNGVIHHTPGTRDVIAEIYRVLKPGGKAIIMIYARNSLQFWRNLVCYLGLSQGQLARLSIGGIMSGSVEMTTTDAKPLVKVYSRREARDLFAAFDDVQILQRQLMPDERPKFLKWLPAHVLERFVGWNLIVKAKKPARVAP